MSYKNARNPQILNDFLDYLLKIKNYSPNTVKAYSSDLLCFFKFLKQYLAIPVKVKDFSIFLLLDVKEADVIAFLVYLNMYRNNTGCTRQRKLVAIRHFYEWLLRFDPTHFERVNPTKNIANIRMNERLPKVLTLAQAKSIQHVFSLDNSIYPLRNNMIVSLFLNTGLRLSELCNLNVCDVNLKDKFIQVVGKR